MHFPDRDTLYLIGCGVHKRSLKSKAIDLYISKRFQLARALAASLNTEAYVLSGKHGLVAPTKRILPYDFDIRTTTKSHKIRWADAAVRDLAKVANGRLIVVVADKSYVELLTQANFRQGNRLKIFNPLAKVDEHEYESHLEQALSFATRKKDLRALYSRIGEMRARGQIFPLRDLSAQKLPEAGVYVFLDNTEPNFFDGDGRIVRVGTHAVSANSKSTLRVRLRNHLGLKDGRGSHRGSIFRSHVGVAMMKREGLEEKFPFWGLAGVRDAEVLQSEAELERKVSAYLSRLDVLAIPVSDAPSKSSLRAHVESQLIALCSQDMAPIDDQTTRWLGGDSPRSEIQLSGLWNLRGVGKLYQSVQVGAVPQVLGLLSEVRNGGAC